MGSGRADAPWPAMVMCWCELVAIITLQMYVVMLTNIAFKLRKNWGDAYALVKLCII